MQCPSLGQIMSFCRLEPSEVTTPETAAEKNQKFAEEATFFISLFQKVRTIRRMPDPELMLVLEKDQTRRKKRKVSKKEKPEKLYFNRKQPDEDLPDNSDRLLEPDV